MLTMKTPQHPQLSTSERFDCSLCFKQFATVHGLEASISYTNLLPTHIERDSLATEKFVATLIHRVSEKRHFLFS